MNKIILLWLFTNAFFTFSCQESESSALNLFLFDIEYDLELQKELIKNKEIFNLNSNGEFVHLVNDSMYIGKINNNIDFEKLPSWQKGDKISGKFILVANEKFINFITYPFDDEVSQNICNLIYEINVNQKFSKISKNIDYKFGEFEPIIRSFILKSKSKNKQKDNVNKTEKLTVLTPNLLNPIENINTEDFDMAYVYREKNYILSKDKNSIIAKINNEIKIFEYIKNIKYDNVEYLIYKNDENYIEIKNTNNSNVKVYFESSPVYRPVYKMVKKKL